MPSAGESSRAADPDLPRDAVETVTPMLDQQHVYRPRVSRETRLLLLIAALALAVLWMLARIRFPDLPVAANPVAPVLAQLAPPSALEDIPNTLAQLEPWITPSLTTITVGD